MAFVDKKKKQKKRKKNRPVYRVAAQLIKRFATLREVSYFTI